MNVPSNYNDESYNLTIENCNHYQWHFHVLVTKHFLQVYLSFTGTAFLRHADGVAVVALEMLLVSSIELSEIGIETTVCESTGDVLLVRRVVSKLKFVHHFRVVLHLVFWYIPTIRHHQSWLSICTFIFEIL